MPRTATQAPGPTAAAGGACGLLSSGTGRAPLRCYGCGSAGRRLRGCYRREHLRDEPEGPRRSRHGPEGGPPGIAPMMLAELGAAVWLQASRAQGAEAAGRLLSQSGPARPLELRGGSCEGAATAESAAAPTGCEGVVVCQYYVQFTDAAWMAASAFMIGCVAVAPPAELAAPTLARRAHRRRRPPGAHHRRRRRGRRTLRLRLDVLKAMSSLHVLAACPRCFSTEA